MTEEQKAAYVMGQAACLYAEVSGMIAANQAEMYKGEPPLYVEKDFVAAIDRSACHHNAALSLFHNT